MLDNNGHSFQINSGSTSALFTKTNLLFIAILITATFAALYPTLSCGFVDWDDPYYLLENDQLKPFTTTWDWHAVKNIFLSNLNGNYNPLPIFTFAIEKYFFAPSPEASPFIFHFTNLWMHVICTLLVFIIFLKMRVAPTGAFIGALLFGIHPMRVESVAWVTERKDVLYGMFYLAAIICYINYTTATQKRKAWYTATLMFAMLSCFSKIQAVCLPLSFVAIDYYNGRKWHDYKILIFEKLPWWVMSLAFGIINLSSLHKGNVFSNTSLVGYSVIEKVAIGMYSYAVYVVKWIYPYTMTHYYDPPAQVPVLAYVSLVLVPLLLIVLLVWAVRKGYKQLVFGWAFFTANVIFMLQIVPVGTAFLADRFTYIGYMGLFFIMGKTYQQFNEKYKQYRIHLNIVLALYCLLLAFMTYNQSKVWKDTISLCGHHIKSYPDSYYGYNQTGVFVLKQAVSTDSNKTVNPQLLMQALRSFMTANKMYAASGRPSPITSSGILQNIGVAHGLLGDNDVAIQYFSQAITYTPNDVEAYKNRGYQYFQSKQFELAIADYCVVIKAKPENSNLYYLRANCYYSNHDLINARKDLDKAIALNATDPNCFIARAVINRAENRLAEARNDALSAQKLGANVPDIYFQ